MIKNSKNLNASKLIDRPPLSLLTIAMGAVIETKEAGL